MGSKSPPPPPQADPGADLLSYTRGLEKALPSLFSQEQQFRPQFGELNLGDISTLLQGRGNQQGLFDLGSQATQESASQIEAARARELQNMGQNATIARGVIGGVSPVAMAATNAQGELAAQRYQAAQGLTAQEQRAAQQATREAFASRGRLNDNASVAGEVLAREDVMRAKREEAQNAGLRAAQMDLELTQPAYGMLQNAPASVFLGQDYLGAGRGAVGAATPQLVDTSTAIGLGQQNRANIANWQANNAAAQNANRGSLIGAGAGIAGSLIKALPLLSFSDKRLKTDIKKVGKTDEGLPIYTYKYKNSPKTQMGVMAQDVKKKKPDALGPMWEGMMTVDYSKIK